MNTSIDVQAGRPHRDPFPREREQQLPVLILAKDFLAAGRGRFAEKREMFLSFGKKFRALNP
jgi:hypothetical protein